MNKIKFVGTEHNLPLVHFKGVISDYTLCGITMDCDPKTGGDYFSTKEKVNCVQCINIVKFCKTIKNNEMDESNPL
jgi:ribosomal protein L33